MAEIENLKGEVIDLIERVYSAKSYPDKYDLVVDRKTIESLVQTITEKLDTNVELKECLDCYYCYTIAISESKEIPILPDYPNKNRLNWIRKYGRWHYQMYLVISKLGSYVMFYWNKYGYFLFKKSKRKYDSPGDKWQPIAAAITEILVQMNIKLLSPPLIFETFNIKFRGNIEGLDKNPSLIKLLFSEELH